MSSASSEGSSSTTAEASETRSSAGAVPLAVSVVNPQAWNSATKKTDEVNPPATKAAEPTRLLLRGAQGGSGPGWVSSWVKRVSGGVPRGGARLCGFHEAQEMRFNSATAPRNGGWAGVIHARGVGGTQ